MRTILSTFADNHDAQRAIAELARHGIDREQISLIHRDMSDPAPVTPESAASDARHVKGAAIGGAAGLLAGGALLFVPGLGPVVIAGALLSALVGAVGGAFLGGLAGTVSGWGVSEEHAAAYLDRVRHGQTLVAIHLPDDHPVIGIEDILTRNNGTRVEPTTLTPTSQVPPSTSTSDLSPPSP